MDYRVVSRSQDAMAAEGTAIIVSYDYVNGRKAPLPPAVRQAIMKIEGRS
jgi:acyl-CoA thioester hydrolase